MVTQTFLQDNGFSADASSAAYTYIKTLASSGNLHAHIKVTFTSAALEKFDIHGTVRTKADAEALGKGRADKRTVGRAIWLYANSYFRTPVEPAFWLQNGGTASTILKYCREVCAQVFDWMSTLELEGATVVVNQDFGEDQLQEIKSWPLKKVKLW